MSSSVIKWRGRIILVEQNIKVNPVIQILWVENGQYIVNSRCLWKHVLDTTIQYILKYLVHSVDSTVFFGVIVLADKVNVRILVD